MRRGGHRVLGNGRQPKRFVRQTLSVALKVQVVQHFDTSETIAATLERYFVTGPNATDT
jgi:hypothetical protein